MRPSFSRMMPSQRWRAGEALAAWMRGGRRRGGQAGGAPATLQGALLPLRVRGPCMWCPGKRMSLAVEVAGMLLLLVPMSMPPLLMLLLLLLLLLRLLPLLPLAGLTWASC